MCNTEQFEIYMNQYSRVYYIQILLARWFYACDSYRKHTNVKQVFSLTLPRNNDKSTTYVCININTHSHANTRHTYIQIQKLTSMWVYILMFLYRLSSGFIRSLNGIFGNNIFFCGHLTSKQHSFSLQWSFFLLLLSLASHC